MKDRNKIIFLILVCVQALHSIEEYIGELWEVFPPAAYLCGLISKDLETGFLIANIGFFVVGLLVWFVFVRPGHALAKYLIWFWIVVELINGIGHTIWSIIQGAYTPGLVTSPILFIVAWYLARLPKSIDDDTVHFAES